MQALVLYYSIAGTAIIFGCLLLAIYKVVT